MDEHSDVLLLYPPLHRLYGERKQWMPLSILCLASYLAQRGISAKAYNGDCDLEEPEMILSYKERFKAGKNFLSNLSGENSVWGEVRKVLEEVSPKVVGISVMTEAMGSVRRMIRLIHELLPTAVIIAGGPHAEIDAEFLLSLGFDYVIKGDGEETLKQLCEALISGQRPKETIMEAVRVPMCELPVPELETHYKFEDYRKVGKKLNITTSRGGCPYACSFCYCSKFKYSLRFQTPKRVAEELEHHVRHYGTKKIFFVDDTFTLDKEYVSKICRQIVKRDIQVSWTCTTRAGQVTDSLLQDMKLAGCKSIHLGIESGSERILKLLNKRIDFDMVEDSVKLIRNNGIDCRMFFMAGLPTESAADLKASIECIQRFRPDETVLDMYVPVPGTPLYEYIRNMGVPLEHTDWCTFSRDKVPYRSYVDDADGCYDEALYDLFNLVERMNNGR